MSGLIISGIIVLAIVAMLRTQRGPVALYCPNCGVTDRPVRETKGSFLIELTLWLCFFVPGLIYSVWRITTRYDACPSCKAGNMIPVDSPRARATLPPAP